jgi:hypothetical protein
MKKLIIKLFKIVAYSFLALLVLGIVTSLFFTAIEDEGEQKTKLEASTKDKGELFASFSLYHGACNEVYKGRKEVYLKDSVYTFYQIDGSKEVIKENMATFWKENWDSNDVKVERKRSKECVANKEKGAAIIRAKQQKNKDIKDLKKKLKNAIDDL